jgi:hypothetical protein
LVQVVFLSMQESPQALPLVQVLQQILDVAAGTGVGVASTIWTVAVGSMVAVGGWTVGVSVDVGRGAAVGGTGVGVSVDVGRGAAVGDGVTVGLDVGGNVRVGV